jgi:hypothetical protein
LLISREISKLWLTICAFNDIIMMYISVKLRNCFFGGNIMKNFKITKKALVLFLCLSALLFSVTAYAATKNWTDTNSTEGTYPVAHKHIYSEWVITDAPTCTETGIRVRECIFAKNGEECPKVYSEVIPVDPDAHTKGNETVTKAPTCYSYGESTYKCECGKEVTVRLDYLSHTYDEDNWTIVEPVHTQYRQTDGFRINVCTVCSDVIEEKIPVEHEYSEDPEDFEIVNAATCTEKGDAIKYCTICKKTLLVEVKLDPDNHVYSGKALPVGTVDCKNGGIGIVACDACGKNARVTIPKEEAHNYLEWYYRDAVGSCKNDGTNGIISKNCKTCGKEFDAKYWSGHILDENAKTHASTCSSYGYKKGKCTVCGKSDAEVVLPINENNHSWIEEVLIEPTCETEGYVFKICKYDSSHVEYTAIEASGHRYVVDWTITKEANCYQEGSRYNLCVDCGKTITEIIPKDPDNHPISEDAWSIYDGKDPSCTEVGVEAAHCPYCVTENDLVFREVPMHSATLWLKSVKEANCKNDGEITYECYECGEDIKEVIPADPDAHFPGEDYIETEEPTCSKEGKMSKVCNICYAAIEADYGEHQQIPVEKTSHIVTDWVVVEKATCTKEGLKTRKCTAEGCGHVEKAPIPKEHRYRSWVILEESEDCQDPGTRTRGCYYCDKEWEETYYVDCEAGDWKLYSGTKGKCVEGNIYRKSCRACNRSVEEKIISAGEHVKLEYQPTEYGVSETICSRLVAKCTYCKEVVMKTTSHTLFKVDNILKQEIKPTCDLPGQTQAYECKDCKMYIDSIPVAALGHNFKYDEDGTKYCTNCNLYYVNSDQGETITCDHFCHNKGTVAKILTKVCSFFWKLFGKNHFCACGSAHYHNEAVTVIEVTENDFGKTVIKYDCIECKVEGETETLK